MDNVSDNDTLETNHDSVLNEDHDGDDELKENGVDSQDESKTKRRSRRVIRVEEENDEATDVSEKLSRRIQRQSSSEDEVVRNRNRTRTASSTSNERRSRRVPSSSEDDIISPRRKDSKISVKDRTSSFEQSSSTENTIGKRGSFASQKSHTVATSGAEEQKRDRFSRNRTISSDQDGMKSPRKTSPQKTSEDRPEWSSSTKVEHERVLTHTVSRKESTTRTNRVSRQESTTHSESDEPKSAAQLKAKWESRASGDNKVANRTKAFGGSTGAAAMRARFENTSSTNYKRRTSSSSQPRNRLASGESVDGEQNTPRHSAASLKARFEAKQADSTPVKRNFVINKGKAAGVAKKFGAANASNKCAVCNKTVYPMEKLEAEGVPYHKFCFKCATCSRTVSLGNYAALEGKIYCKPHLKQLFKLKGNYDEGFGRAQRKADWVNKDANTKSFDTEVESKQQENGSEVNGHDPDTREEVTVNGYDE